MKCHGQRMYFSADEFMWTCHHCGRDKFAVRSAYNFFKKDSVMYKDKEKFVKKWIKSVQPIAERAWIKTHKPI